MIEAYKFLNSRYADDFQSGGIRIAAAHTFRPFDGFDDGRSDAMELIDEAKIAGGAETLPGDHPVLSEFFTIIRGGKRVYEDIQIGGESFGFVDNCYLLCLSLDCSEITKALMKEKFGADACFRISDADAFVKVLSDAPELSQHSMETGPVSYDKAVMESVASLEGTNVFSKRPEFAWQNEWRACWRGPIFADAFTLTQPSARTLLTRLF